MIRAGRQIRPAYRLYQWAWRSLDWLFPPICGGCNQPGDRWCINCRSSLRQLPVLVCDRCGLPHFNQGLCPECRGRTPSFEKLRSFAVYEGAIRNALHSLKYRKNISLGEALSAHLIQLYDETGWQTDLIVPVPLSKQRFKERGYNQVGLIARPLALAFGIPYEPRAVRRHKENLSQVGLSGEIRRQNVIGAFLGDASIIRGKRILVIDDIVTTGATMEACARALIDAQALQVNGLSLARSLMGARRESEQIQ